MRDVAGRVLDFDALEGLTCGFVSVREGGSEWRLRDDVRTDIMLDVFRMTKLEQRLQALMSEQDEDETMAAFEELFAMSLRICTRIFRHTYRGTSEAEIDQRFSHTDRLEIIQLFFGRDGSASTSTLPEPPNSSEATSSTPTRTTSTTRMAGLATGTNGPNGTDRTRSRTASRTPRERATKGKRVRRAEG